MGRTLLSSTQLVLKEKSEWAEFRRALRKEDKEIFDKIFSHAKFHSQAVSNSGAVYPFEAVLLCILIEQQKEIMELKKGKSDEGLFD